MKFNALLLAFTLTATLAMAQDYHYVKGYVKRDGTVVSGHYQTNPNGSKADNWSTIGNTNPITGQPGTKNPYETPGGYHTTPRR